MKNLFVILFLILGTESMACTNLSGNYICKTSEVPGGDPHTVIIDQTEDTYTETMIQEDGSENREQFPIDGKSHIGAFGIWYKLSCEANSTLTLKVRSPFLVTSAIVEYVSTKNGFTKYRQQSGDVKKVFQVCTLQ